jgi:hypothetical protein
MESRYYSKTYFNIILIGDHAQRTQFRQECRAYGANSDWVQGNLEGISYKLNELDPCDENCISLDVNTNAKQCLDSIATLYMQNENSFSEQQNKFPNDPCVSNNHYSYFEPAQNSNDQTSIEIFYTQTQNANARKIKENISSLYRVQNLNTFFNLPVFVLGIFSTVQHKIVLEEHIAGHQKSAAFVGSSSRESTASQIQKFRDSNNDNKGNENGILTINPKLINNYIYDVEKNVSSFGTNFFTQINESEYCMPILPICVIESIKLNINDKDKVIKNPFYISPDNENIIQEYQAVYQAHKYFLETLFELGTEITQEKRQEELNKLLNSYDAFYQKYLGNNNFLSMTITQFNEKFAENFSSLDIQIETKHDITIKELLIHHGDQLFMNKDEYKRLLTKKESERLRQLDQNYYGRSSYSYE